MGKEGGGGKEGGFVGWWWEGEGVSGMVVGREGGGVNRKWGREGCGGMRKFVVGGVGRGMRMMVVGTWCLEVVVWEGKKG